MALHDLRLGHMQGVCQVGDLQLTALFLVSKKVAAADIACCRVFFLLCFGICTNSCFLPLNDPDRFCVETLKEYVFVHLRDIVFSHVF